MPNLETIFIAIGHPIHVVIKGMANPNSSLSLANVLYVPIFPINLLSISVIPKTLFLLIFFSVALFLLGFADMDADFFGRENGRGRVILFIILLLLIYFVFFHTNHLLLNCIFTSGTLASLNVVGSSMVFA